MSVFLPLTRLWSRPPPLVLFHRSHNIASPFFGSSIQDSLDPYSAVLVYYQLFGRNAPRISKQAFDQEDPTVGRVLARGIAPPRTALIVKRYIANLEGIDESLLVDLYLNDGQGNGEPVQDDARVPIILQNGHGYGPGSTPEAPLAITVREPRPHVNTLALASSPLTSPSTSSAPPPSSSPVITLSDTGAPPSSSPVPRASFSSAGASSSLSPLEQTDPQPPLTEPGKVASDVKPRGWVTAHLTRKTGTIPLSQANEC